MKKLPIGLTDFKKVITGNYYYADKSLFIQELLRAGAAATLIPRPRRFGKTLNLSLLQYFFEKTEQSHVHLFADLAISEDAESMAHQGQYPVIYISFKDAKGGTWQQTHRIITSLIIAEYKRHLYLLEGTLLDKTEKEDFYAIIERTADAVLYAESLKNLTVYLARYHKKNPIILIDEYDSPIHAGFTGNYYNDVMGFMRLLLSSCLKDNNNLEFAVMTGILRVAKESIFSGLNNLSVWTLLFDRFSDKFGFTQKEVDQLLQEYHLDHYASDIQKWYNGYQSGNIRIYNPWSIISFADKGKFQPYWVNTSDNKLIQRCLRTSDSSVKERLEKLIQNEPITEPINENIIFADIDSQDTVLWNFLLFSGYLTFHNPRLLIRTTIADLSIPNDEVLALFEDTILSWFAEKSGAHYTTMIDYLVKGNTTQFKQHFTDVVADTLSYFDVNKQEPENFYHALVLGMLVSLSQTHTIKSNRESGYGRYDVMIIPKNHTKPGIIIEFKKADRGETLTEAAQRALDQINERQYERELRERGVAHIIKLGIAFQGKQVLVVEG